MIPPLKGMLNAMKKTIASKKGTAKPAVKRKQSKQQAGPAVVQPVPTTETSKISKKDQVLALLRREGGATLDEIMTATGWQKHSVRGFISGALRKKLGLTVERREEHYLVIQAS